MDNEKILEYVKIISMIEILRDRLNHSGLSEESMCTAFDNLDRRLHAGIGYLTVQEMRKKEKPCAT